MTQSRKRSCTHETWTLDSSQPLSSLRGFSLIKEHCHDCGHQRQRISKGGSFSG